MAIRVREGMSSRWRRMRSSIPEVEYWDSIVCRVYASTVPIISSRFLLSGIASGFIFLITLRKLFSCSSRSPGIAVNSAAPAKVPSEFGSPDSRSRTKTSSNSSPSIFSLQAASFSAEMGIWVMSASSTIFQGISTTSYRACFSVTYP